MKKARRLLNVVTEKLGGGSLSRIDANRHLFFPSTAQALQHRQIQQQQAAAAATEKDDYDGVLRLLPPKFRFQPSPSDKSSMLEFFPFGGGGGEGTKIVCVDEAGRSLLYDADACTVHTMPTLNTPTRLWSSASFAATRSADDAHDPDRPDALYLLDRAGGSFQFQALVYGDPDGDPRPCPELADRSMWLDLARGSFAWHWRQLPPPPVHDDDHHDTTFFLQSYALLHGTTICVSFDRQLSRNSRCGTYCFDTGAGKWTKAGDWTLPFYRHSRALHVPELGQDLLFGISGPRFCAVDVSGAMKTTNDGSASAPVLQHAWADVDSPQPEEWYPSRDSVAYLGAGRFCIHRGFDIMTRDGYGACTRSTRRFCSPASRWFEMTQDPPNSGWSSTRPNVSTLISTICSRSIVLPNTGSWKKKSDLLAASVN